MPVGTLNYVDYKYLINRDLTNMRLCPVFADPVTYTYLIFSPHHKAIELKLIPCSWLTTIYFIVADSNKQPHQLCILVYYIPDDFKPTLKPHGNSKTDKPFYGTLPSTIHSIA